MVASDNLKFGGKEARNAFRGLLTNMGSANSKSANGRSVRNILEEAKRQMAVRLQQQAMSGKKMATNEELITLMAADFEGQ